MQIKYSIVLPCYNEFKSSSSYSSIIKNFEKKKYEIICVDDDSKDHTVPKLKKFLKVIIKLVLS